MKTNASMRLKTTAKTDYSERLQKLKARRAPIQRPFPSTAKKTTAATKVMAIELPKFRYISDVTRFLDQMKDEIDDLDSLIKVQQKQLAYLHRPRDTVKAAIVNAATFEFTIDPDAGAKKTHLKRKIDPELTKIVVPNIKKLEEQYGLSEDLYEKHRTLESLETQLSMQFPKKNSTEVNEALSTLRALKNKVGERLKEVLGFLNEVAAEHVPRTFKRYMDAIIQEVQEHVMFESNQVFLYVSATPEGQLVFTSYLMLVNATNDEGEITPHLYISVQWIVGETVHVQINHEYELPNALLKDPGSEVGSVGEAVKEISHLLSLEDFATSLGTVPLATQLKMDPSKVTEGMFTYKSFIKKVSIDADKLVFDLRPGVTTEQLDEIKYPLYQEVKELFKRSRNIKLRMAVTKKAVVFTVINVAEKGEVNVSDAEFLKDKFGINDTQLRKVVNVLNNPKGKEEAGLKEITASLEILSADWFDTLSEIQKKEYVKEHPNSKYAKGWTPNKGEDVDDAIDAEEAPEDEGFLSKLRNKIIEKLGGQVMERSTHTRKGFSSGAIFLGSDGEERQVKLLYSPGAIQKGPGDYSYGYWKDKDTYIQMTKKEFKGLNKKQLQNLEHRQEMYGLN